jgi:ribulose-phosphate 3-epimerase
MESPVKTELRELVPLLSVGLISADLMNLADAETRLADSGVRLLHFDVMDGRFCPQFTVGPSFVKGIRTGCYKDVHLMVEDPLPMIPEFAAAGADIITVHIESGRHIHRALQVISEQKNVNENSRGILRGIALNPGTPVASIEPFTDSVDIMFLLAINPGFPNQSFIESTACRFSMLKEMTAQLDNPPLLGIDGGITAATIGKAASFGADIIVSGSAVFKDGSIRNNLELLHSKMTQR